MFFGKSLSLQENFRNNWTLASISTKASTLTDAALAQLNSGREKPNVIIDMVEKTYEDSSWPNVQVRRRKKMDREKASGDAPENRQGQWERETFYVLVDKVTAALSERFMKILKYVEIIAHVLAIIFPYLSSEVHHYLTVAVRGGVLWH